jgi:hypothetical protein
LARSGRFLAAKELGLKLGEDQARLEGIVVDGVAVGLAQSVGQAGVCLGVGRGLGGEAVAARRLDRVTLSRLYLM